MGAIKQLFTDIQLALDNRDFVELMKVLQTLPEEHRAKWLFDTVETLAAWQREEQERQNQKEWLQVKTGILRAIKNMEGH